MRSAAGAVSAGLAKTSSGEAVTAGGCDGRGGRFRRRLRRRVTQRDAAIEQRHVLFQRSDASAHAQHENNGDDRHHGSNEVHDNLPARVARTQFHACVAASVNLVQK